MIGGRSALLGASGGRTYGNWTGNYSDVSLLLRNGAPGTTLVPADESPTPKRITAQGSASVSNTIFKYGTSSFFHPDVSASFFRIPSPGDSFQFPGDYTIELWVYHTALASDTSAYVSFSGSGPYHAFNIDSTNFNLYLNTSSPSLSVSHGLTLNAWHHIALCRSGSTVRVFAGGTQRGSMQSSGTHGFNNPGNCQTGGGVAGTSRYIDDLRVTKGIARYVEGTGANAGKMVFAGTNDLALPTAELPSNVTDDPSYNSVSLLLRNALALLTPLDESPTPKTITAVGNASISTTTFKYGDSSLAFDGSGAYFEITDTNNDFDLGGTNATLELWAYSMTTSGYDVLLTKHGGGANWNVYNGFEYQIQYDKSANRFVFVFNNFPFGPSVISGGTQATGSWYHLAIVTNTSNNITFYVNGISVGSVTNSIGKPTTRTSFRLGTDLSGADYAGYIDDLRITRNFARYTKNFLPPPAQLPAI